jgi:hypothetical protein
MILGFKTHINGKPTMFTNRIVKIMWQQYSSQMKDLALSRKHPEFYVFEDLTGYEQEKLMPKLHTICEDKNDRWKPGVMIDFFINTRTKNMFRFAPRIPVVSDQTVKIIYPYKGATRANVYIGNKLYYSFMLPSNENKIIELAQNDGFDTVEDFFAYFNEDFSGKIIHWTGKRY